MTFKKDTKIIIKRTGLNLFGEQIVKGNMKDGLQVYNILYYEPRQDFPMDKIWIFFNRKEKGEYKFTKSLCFASTEQLEHFISLNIYSLLLLIEKRSIDYKLETMTIHDFRIQLLDRLMSSLKRKQIERWKEKIKLMVNH